MYRIGRCRISRYVEISHMFLLMFFYPWFPMSFVIVESSSSEQPFTERLYFYGSLLAAIGYGIVVILSASSTQQFCMWTRNHPLKRSIKVLLLYTSLVFVLATISLVSCILEAQDIFVGIQPYHDQEPFDAGPSHCMANVSFLLGNWAANGIMFWRFIVVHRRACRPVRLALIFPALMFLISLITSIIWIMQRCLPQSPDNATGMFSINWTTFYLILSLVLNITFSTTIVIRIMIYRHQSQTSWTLDSSAHLYFVSALLVGGSCLLYSIFSLLFLIPFMMKSPIAKMFLPVLSQVQIIAPLILIYRIAQGKSWEYFQSITDALTATMSFAVLDPTPGVVEQPTDDIATLEHHESDNHTYELQAFCSLRSCRASVPNNPN